MTKSKRIAVGLVVGLVLVLAGPLTLALEGNLGSFDAQGLHGGVKHLSRHTATAKVAIPLPYPVPEPIDPHGVSGALRGPVALATTTLDVTRGASALVGPRGGVIATPKQQADREIERMIKKLR